MKKNVHVIPHSHWDREWYMPFEYHRAYLVKLIDNCMELFENDSEFKSFHLDGHTALIEDYLEIKPENKEKIKKYVKEGRFAIGPWYVLQDEFLTSSEANIRNLLVGMDIARSYGKITPIGYFPDSFGNAGQMPQLMKQAGMKAVVFGRGVKPTGGNNEIFESNNYASQYSELYWQSPDGSTMPAILFANWYSNGMEMPEDGNKERLDKTLEAALKYASTDELLLMNGCDHQPVQKNLSKALRAARENYPDYNFIHSDFETYTDSVLKALPDNLAVVKGELIGQDTDGWYSLVNTCSSHIDLKVANCKGEILLENIAEPLSVIASCMGKEYPRHMLTYAWKTLMQNHPHDSICGCSCDEVNAEMAIRFAKSRQAAEAVVKDNCEYISSHIDTSAFEGCDAVFAVVNTYTADKTGVVKTRVDVRRVFGDVFHMYDDVNKDLYTGAYELTDENGNTIPCTVENPAVEFGYLLPDDRFRQPYMAQRVTIEFEAENVPSLGYGLYGLKKTEKNSKFTSMVCGKNSMENEYLRVNINADGTLCVYDKKNNRTFDGLMRFEDVGDIGQEYTFVPCPNDKPILSGNENVKTELVCDTPYKAQYKVSVDMTIPASGDELCYEQIAHCTGRMERCGSRSAHMVTLNLISYITLEKNSRSVKIKTDFENKAKNHRLRVLFPSDIRCDTHKVESIFEAVERPNRHKDTWTYPSGCEHQQGFVMLSDAKSGMAVANTGLYEYEILPDNTVAVNLVRATGDLGDWGVFPTELSQSLKPLSLEYSFTPFRCEDELYSYLPSLRVDMLPMQIMQSGDGAYKGKNFSWRGDCLRATAVKRAQNSDDIIMRWANYSDREQILEIDKSTWIDNIYRSNIVEEKFEFVGDNKGKWSIKVKPFEVLTLGCCKNK